jgi:hypothetical protein
MKIRPVGGELFHAVGWADGQTYMTNLIVAFRSLANAPNETPTQCTHTHTHTYIYVYIYMYKTYY